MSMFRQENWALSIFFVVVYLWNILKYCQKCSTFYTVDCKQLLCLCTFCYCIFELSPDMLRASKVWIKRKKTLFSVILHMLLLDSLRQRHSPRDYQFLDKTSLHPIISGERLNDHQNHRLRPLVSLIVCESQIGYSVLYMISNIYFLNFPAFQWE